MLNKDPALGTLKGFVMGVAYSTSSLGNLEYCQVHLINLLNVTVGWERMLSLLGGHAGILMGTVL